MASPQFSKIYYELDDSGKSRYREKLNRIGDGVQDPYFPHSSFLPTEEYPLVEYSDIYNYHIDAPSPHTKEQLKAYKSLQGYQFCLAGWQRPCVHCWKIVIRSECCCPCQSEAFSVRFVAEPSTVGSVGE